MYLVNRYHLDYDAPKAGIALSSSVECETWGQVLTNVFGALSPSAFDMPIGDVIHQVNNVNAGELLILCAGSGMVSTSMVAGHASCPACETSVPVRASTMADHAPGASDPYS